MQLDNANIPTTFELFLPAAAQAGRRTFMNKSKSSNPGFIVYRVSNCLFKYRATIGWGLTPVLNPPLALDPASSVYSAVDQLLHNTAWHLRCVQATGPELARWGLVRLWGHISVSLSLHVILLSPSPYAL